MKLELMVLLSAVQFISVIEYMMLSPLGPDLAHSVGVPLSSLPFLTGIYALAAGTSTLISASWIDRWNRRSSLLFCLIGLTISTFGCSLAFNKTSLLLARAAAGAFSGPIHALILAAVADLVPQSRRGVALGTIMMAFPLSAVAGVPLSLELAMLSSWRLPLLVVGAAAAILSVIVRLRMPALSPEIGPESKKTGLQHIAAATKMPAPLCLVAVALVTLSAFSVIPSFSPHFQFNLGYPREKLGTLFFFGGLATLFTSRLAGWCVDRLGLIPLASIGALGWAIATTLGILLPHSLPLTWIFPLFMVSNNIRFVSSGALGTKIIPAEIRGVYLSFQGTLQHFGSGLGAVIASYLTYDLPGPKLGGMTELGLFSIAFGALAPVFVWLAIRTSTKTATF